MERSAEIQPCPYCGRRFRRLERVMEHIERRHTENSGFVVRHGPSHSSTPSPPLLPPRRPVPALILEPPPRPTRSPPVPPGEGVAERPNGSLSDDPAEDDFVACPLEECGEMVLSSELTEHIELHQAEQLTLDDKYLTADHHHSNGPTSHPSSSSPDAQYPPAFESYYAPAPAGLPSNMSSASSSKEPDSASSYKSPTISSRSSYPSAEQSVADDSSLTSGQHLANFSTAIPDALRSRRERSYVRRHLVSTDSSSINWDGIKRRFLQIDDRLNLDVKLKTGTLSKSPKQRSSKPRLGVSSYKIKLDASLR